MLHFLTGPGHRHRIEGKARCTEDKQCRRHRGITEHGETTHDHHKDLNAQHQQTAKAVGKATNRPLSDNPGADHHRHPETDPGITDSLVVQIERHESIQRTQYNPGDNTAIYSQTRLTQSQHWPDVGCLLMLAALVHNTRKEQRQNSGQHHAGHPRQDAHQVSWQFADHQLTQHGSDVIDHHIGRQQTPTVAGGATAHQGTLHYHPDHGAANARNKAPGHPAPESDHQP